MVMNGRRLGLVHPGEMGSAMGRVLVEMGHRVLWASEGRSNQTRQRAEAAGLIDHFTLPEMVSQAEIILSICPPHAAAEVAREVVSFGFPGGYADCNAISPRCTRLIEEVVVAGGGKYVDGGIIGGPPSEHYNPTLYLSGPATKVVQECFMSKRIQVEVLSSRIGAASALKMAYAANSKGVSALLAAIMVLAEQEGVRGVLQRQWGKELTISAHQRAIGSALKAWRFVGEMREIADTFADAGLPSGFHESAAEIYNRLSSFRERSRDPDLDEVLEALN